MIYLLIFIFVLLAAIALASYLAAHRSAQRTRLPAGRLLYSDTGFPVGRIASIIKNAEGARQEKPLVSERHGLTGRPDYLVQTDEGIIPVEIKSTKSPPGGRAYDSHLMQLAAYCLLAEDVLDSHVPYGIIQYADGEVIIEYTAELRDDLLALLAEMREASLAEDVHRSHTDARRCAGCSMREICTESLA